MEQVPGASTPPTHNAPSLGVVVMVFHRLSFYQRALESISAQLGGAGPIELVIVRSPDVEIEVPESVRARVGSCQVVRSEAVGEGPFFAEGVRALRSDFVAPLDDDDLWAPDRLARLTAELQRFPRAGFYHNGQSFVDGDGSPMDSGAARRHLRRFGGVPSGRAREVSTWELRHHPSRLARWGSFFNNSSVAVRRSTLLEAGEELGSIARMLDSFMFYCGASSGETLVFDPAPTTRYRIHSGNRSRGSSDPAAAQVPESFPTRGGRMSSLEVIRSMVERRGVRWLGEWLDHDRAYFDLLEGFREGEPRRGTTLRRTLALAPYTRYADPLMNVVLMLTAAGLAASPGLAHRAYWVGSPPGTSGGGSAPPPPPEA